MCDPINASADTEMLWKHCYGRATISLISEKKIQLVLIYVTSEYRHLMHLATITNADTPTKIMITFPTW